MIKQMQKKFNKYLAKCSLVLSCAAILDPRYFWETILSNHRLLFDEYIKKSKSTYSFLVGSFNIPDNNPVGSSLHQYNVNNVDFGGDYDESDYYKWYLNESSSKSEKP
ncbi:hypothetical protein Gotur_022162 [Gossypium turneri]